MKALMIDVVNRTYKFIHELFDEEAIAKLLLQSGLHAGGPLHVTRGPEAQIAAMFALRREREEMIERCHAIHSTRRQLQMARAHKNTPR
jgi:hypothetical protein